MLNGIIFSQLTLLGLPQDVPWGFRKLLVWIRDQYRNPPLVVTENGFADHGELDDQNRIKYYTVSMSGSQSRPAPASPHRASRLPTPRTLLYSLR